MEYLRIHELEEGMVVSKNVVDKDCILLAENVKLTKRYIEQLSQRRVEGIYVLNDNIIVTNEANKESVSVKVIEMLNEITINISKSSNLKEISSKITNMLKYTNLDSDEENLTHSLEVAKLSVLVGQSMNLTADELYLLGMSAMFHENIEMNMCEKIKKASKIRKLTLQEKIRAKVIIKHNCKELVKNNIPENVKEIIEESFMLTYCNDVMDSKGENSKLANILNVCDYYESSVSQNKIEPNNVTRSMLDENKNLDKDVVRTFINCTKIYPTDSLVQLNNGKIGTVLKGYNNQPSRPKVRLLGTYEAINLANEENQSIEIERVCNI